MAVAATRIRCWRRGGLAAAVRAVHGGEGAHLCVLGDQVFSFNAWYAAVTFMITGWMLCLR